ncbi:uncharacterized protein LOC117371861 isoform X2 [Periophthalmus magnuspinnatus]|uniref:uncharacterized protein LOC117371861 isoform X2 n=1 Tax=Periophthalmus magnuspinnatus TaxID=409849 RepID=UPI002437456B|nr:uncharacterized protein LOC117371861 isoform X2 [Periophthalmus magnuspinnatus]XP_055078220.1 uncharacterized protein LOC117371861 isoform X2 [Periophthalmus magnuspinnatus]
MASRNGASPSTGIVVPVPVNSDVFNNSILTKLESAYLFEDSKHSFRYTSAFLIKNPALEEKYNACREKRREQGYSDKDLKETYGFLLFDQLNKAKSIGETGMLAENGTCTTLGDPTKGVYLSMYSDCLDPNCWYHGKSGYIVIVKITEGRVKKVSENYTHNLTKPTVGFDCHVSEQLQSVSSKTSSFLAFERTQYYLYELLDNGSTALSPSLACPYAVVAFSYTDNTVTLETQQENCEEKKAACPYSPWIGKLQLGAQIFNIGIRSTAGALAWAKLPSIIKVEWVISMLILRKLLPKAIFETTFNGQEHVFCCQCEIVTLNLEEKDRLAPLLLEIKKQDVALIIALSDGGFLVLIHDSNFISHDKDNGLSTNKVLQGVFVFPESQIIQKDTKIQRMKQSLSSDALRVLPLLIYAEGEIEKTSIKPEEDLCDIVVQHMQSYATLISPSFPLSPFREVDIFPDQYDVLDAHQHLYSTPEWTDTQWQSLKSYLSNASSFQLPVCKASEILLVGQEARQEDLEDDIYICLSSPEEPSTSLISTGSEDRLDQKCSSATEASQDSMQPVSAISQLLVPSVLPTQERTSEMFDSTVYTDKGDVSIETKEVPLRTVEHSEELIVSITSAARTVDDEILDVIKHDQLSVTAKIQQATLNTFSEIVQSKVTLNCSDDNIFLTESDKLPQGHNLESPETPSLQMVKTLLKKDESMCSDDVPTQKLSLHEDRCEIQRNEHESDQLSKNTQSLEKTVSISLTDNALLKELETCALRKKSERWGLKPVVSTCGSIFIPYGSVETEEIRFLQEKLQLEKTVVSSEVSKCSGDNQQMSNMPIEEVASKSDTIKARMKDVPIAGQSKSQLMLRKLKSVILKKRKVDALKEDLNINCTMDNELRTKRIKNDMTPVTIRNINDTCAKEFSVGDQNDPNLLSVDPLFAHALGLTPKRPQNIKALDINAGHISDSSGAKEMFVTKDGSPYKPQSLSSPKGTRLKMLKKNQNLSADQVKKKWWLHFQTPACYAEKQFQECLSDNSVSKIIQEKTNTSSEALNLLADLALCANKGQVSPHRTQECEFQANVTSPEQQTVLHALLSQPDAKSVQPQEPPSPDGFGGTGLVDAIYKEHAYSLPSSSSLPLALPAPFQVSPLNGSSRLLHALRLWGEAQQMPPLSLEDKVEENKRAPGDPKRSWYRRKFRLSRTIENRDKTVHVTRHWKEDYDFNLDSRFTVDPKDKTIVRALHGPWDSSIHDTNEEIQIIVHMWIGLFYSRSTARFFHLDPDVTFPAPENNVFDGVKVSNEKRPEQNASNIAVHSPLLNVADKPEVQVLDLSKPKNCAIDTEPLCLNLSQKLSSVETANENLKVTTQELMATNQVPEELNTLNPQVLPTTLPIQWYLNLSAGVAPYLNYVGMPANNGISSELNQVFIPVWNRITKQSICTNDTQTPSMASAESGESHQTEDTCENFPKRPEVPIRRQDSCKRQRKKTQRNAYLSASPNKKESPENKMHAKNLSDSNTSTDRRPTNGDVNAIRSNNLLEIKKKYMEKLKAASSQVNQKIDSSAPQNDTEVGQCILLKKLLREEKPTIAVTPKLQALSKKTVVYKNAAKTCDENGWINPKTNETICNINLNGHTSLNIIGVDPLVESKNLKTSHSQEISVRKQDVMVENPSIDCRGLSQDEYVKTIKSPVINTDSISYEHPNDETENSKNCDVNSCTGINTSLEDKSLEQTCNEVDNQGFEDMEFVPSESSEVMVQLSTNSDNASYDGHSQHRKLFAAGSEVNHPSDLRDSETDDRCPTPTIDEQPFVYLSQSKTNSDVNELDEVCPDADKREPSTSLTPVMDKTLVELVPKAFNCDPITNVGTQSDIELRTLRTLKCLDEYLSTLQNKTHQSLLNSEDTPNSPICLKKRRSALIHNPNDMKSTSSMSDSCRPEVKYESSQYISPFNEANMQQVKQMCPTESLCVPDLFPTDDSGRLTKSNVNVEEGGLKSNQSSSSTSPGVAERPSKIVKEQGHFISPNKLKANPDCEAQSKPFIRFSIKRIRQGGFVCHGPVFEAHQNEKCSENFASRKCKHPDKQELQTIQAEAISSSISAQPVESHASPVLQVLKHDPYIMVKDNKSGDEDFLNYSTSFVDSKTNKITDHSLGIQGSLSCTVSNTGRKLSSFLEKVSKRCMQDDPTQSSMDRECLIFMDQMKQLLKRKQDQGAQCDQSNQSSSCPITVQFSHLQEQDDVLDDTVIPSAFINQKISVDMSDRKLLKDPTQQISLKPQAHGALEQPGVSAITAQCTRLYRDIMNKICSGSRNASLLRDLHKNDFEDSTANSSNYFDFCSQMKREMDDHFHTSLNSVVKKSCKTKNRFFLLITSDDAFFNKTQAYLEAEGHIAVQPSDFFIRESSSSPLLVIVRNEDIAGHIFEVPHLLELRKSLVVQFAGIDEPDDVVNLTYQELFIKGGFVMFDKGAVESLSPGK